MSVITFIIPSNRLPVTFDVPQEESVTFDLLDNLMPYWDKETLKGEAATVAVGTVTTGAAGTNASVTNVGDSHNAVFNFTIPKGDKGDKGDTGNTGTAATIAVGNVTSGSTASVSNSGTSSAAVFDFVLPKGDKGDTGNTGASGTAATISIGTVSTGAAGSDASVTNSGTTSAAVFNFTIPKGDKGDTGSQGAAGILWATYDVTPFSDLVTAYNAGRLIVAEKDGAVFRVTDVTRNSSDQIVSFTFSRERNNIFGTYSSVSSVIVEDGWGWDDVTTSTVAPLNSPPFTGTPTAPTAVAGTNTTQIATTAFVKTAVDNAVVGALQPAGSVTFANLPALTAANLNKIVNVSDAFTTTSDFVEGTGKSYPAGTNVAIINVGTSSSPSYKYDTYTGTFDFSSFATKVSSATSGNFAALDANGNLVDSGHIHSDYITTETDPVFSASAAAGITSSDISAWNAKGTYSKPSDGIPAIDLASAVQTSLGKADTALQSFTETDPTVPSWAKQSSKPTYTASEVGALPSSTVIPSKTSDLTNDSGFITGYTETDPVFSASAAAGITSTNISTWNNKGTYSKPNGGIPATDLASAVQASLGLADKAVITDTEQTVTGAKTFQNVVKIQNGQGTGSIWVGGNVNANAATNNQRHLARIVVPSYANVNLGATLLGFDTSGDSDANVSGKTYDVVSFGGMKKITNATSPMAIVFCVASERAATAAAKKVYPLEMDATTARFNVQPNYNGNNLLTTATGVTSVNGSHGDVTIPTLPSVSSSDNGKILQVVNGAWAAASLPTYNGGVS